MGRGIDAVTNNLDGSPENDIILMDIALNYILFTGIIIITGFVFGELANKVKLPKATGYLVAGILLNPDLFISLLDHKHFVEASQVVLNISLAIIAFSIGGGLHRKELKSMGGSIVSIGINQAEITLLIVAFGLIGLFRVFPPEGYAWAEYLVPMSIILGSLALPTDPAAFLAVKNELKAKGRLTTTTLGIAAIDDMLTFLNFVLAVSIAGLFLNSGEGNLGMELLKTLGEIAASIALGAVMGGLLNLVTGLTKKETEGVLIVLALGFILACYGLAEAFHLEKLLTNMSMGIVVVNFNPIRKKIFDLLERYTEELVFVLFFTLSGIQLNFDIIDQVLLLVGVFVVLRFAGKWAGTFSGALMAGSDKKIKRYTTWALLPQGGIVIGLGLTLQQDPAFSSFADIILGVVIISSVVFEIIGSITTKYALEESGEAKAE